MQHMKSLSQLASWHISPIYTLFFHANFCGLNAFTLLRDNWFFCMNSLYFCCSFLNENIHKKWREKYKFFKYLIKFNTINSLASANNAMNKTSSRKILFILLFVRFVPLNAKFELNKPSLITPLYTVLLIAIAVIAHELIRADRSSTKVASRLSTNDRVNIVYAISFTQNAANIIFPEIGTNSLWNEKFRTEWIRGTSISRKSWQSNWVCSFSSW